jgi:xylulokinase
MPNYYIGYDCGTMGTKVAVYLEDSSLISETYRPHVIKYPKPGWAEMNPEQFYDVVTDGIKECMTKSRINPESVKGIACSGIICGFLPIDYEWRPLGPYIPYLDGRAKDEALYIAENREPIWIEESGSAIVGAHLPPIIIRWLINNQQEVIKDTKKVITCAHYVMGKLGGLKAKDAFIDWGHLSGWGIGFDARRRNWSEKQIEEFGIPYEILPEVKKPWDIVGTLTKEEADKTGLKEGTPLIAGSGDVMQSNLGSGAVEVGMCTDIAGTASIYTFLVEGFNKEITNTKALYNAMGTLDDQYMYYAFIPAGGLSLRWYRDDVIGRKDDEEFYDEMNKLAQKVPLGSEFSLFLPYLQGRSCPFWQNASAAWLGLYGSNNSGTLWRSMLEAIAFEYLSWVNILRKVGAKLTKIIGTGGGSKGKLWNQIKADMLNLPYVTLKRTEGAVLGNALLAAYGVGDIKNIKETVYKWVRTKDEFVPDRARNEAYTKIYEKRQELLNGPLREVFEKLMELHEIAVPE